MANIVLVGFNPHEGVAMREIIEDTLRDMGKAKDAVTTILPADTKWCDKPNRAPYLIVRDISHADAVAIATTLNAKVNMDVEYETIGFLPSTPYLPAAT